MIEIALKRINEIQSQVQQMAEKEDRLLEIYTKQQMEDFYGQAVAEFIVQLSKVNRTLSNLTNMYFVVGGIQK